MDSLVDPRVENREEGEEYHLATPRSVQVNSEDSQILSQLWTFAVALLIGVLLNVLHRYLSDNQRLPRDEKCEFEGEMGNLAAKTASLGTISANNKMTIVIRTDLNMSKVSFLVAK